MPQTAFEGGIFHVRAYVFFPEIPQNRTYSFSVLFSFSNRSRAFFLFGIRWENGAFQEKRTEKIGAVREKST